METIATQANKERTPKIWPVPCECSLIKSICFLAVFVDVAVVVA